MYFYVIQYITALIYKNNIMARVKQKNVDLYYLNKTGKVDF